MEKVISDYYKSEYRAAFWWIGVSIFSFFGGLISIAKLDHIGAGILVIFGGFGIYQIIRGFWILFVDQDMTDRKVKIYSKDQDKFQKSETQNLTKKDEKLRKNKTPIVVSCLVGLFLLFWGAFGNQNDLWLGMGIGLSLQSLISLGFNLMAGFRTDFYLQKVKKIQ